MSDKRDRFRALLEKKSIIVAPGVYDCLGARIVDSTGFDAVYVTGFGTSTGLLGRPDLGFLTLSELARTAGNIDSTTSLPVIADASHSMGAKYRGKPIPRLAEAAVFSFHSTKNLTCGEGGMVVSRFGPLVDIIRKASLHGLTAGAYARRLQKKWLYDVEQLGFKANMSDVHAAIGLVQCTLNGGAQESVVVVVVDDDADQGLMTAAHFRPLRSNGPILALSLSRRRGPRRLV